ncbi:MAG: adenosyl-hopene transferase HpnH [Acidobacteriota bacterium]|nr:adenosyl-hopene transferase HpnH [Blastocatellia bacterium]MDW8411350.1 adenosyl-hopene transferase HpnH [Acidobacteriota bacterium]
MRFPLGFTLAQARHRAKMEKAGIKRYPTVLMLEPLYTCNLACLGCSVGRYTGKLKDRMPLQTCFKAVDDCGAPIVNICGGEPTLYPELKQLVEGLHARDKYVLLCTNALKLDEKVYGVIPPSDKLLLMIHLDGMSETHDFICNRKGVFDKAVEMIRKGKQLGYYVYINTTVYKETKVEEVEQLCKLVDELNANGILISPGYHYESVDRDIFLTRDEIHSKFKAIRSFAHKYKVNATPTFLDFAAGLLELPCSPWSTVNYTPKGWKAPCYLIEGGGYFQDWDTFWKQTDWAYWESRQDRRCQNCKMHSGFEHSAVEASMQTLTGKLRLAVWSLR